MEKLVEQGLCKAIGISNFTIKKITELLEGKVNIVPACNQGIKKNALFIVEVHLAIKLVYRHSSFNNLKETVI